MPLKGVLPRFALSSALTAAVWAGAWDAQAAQILYAYNSVCLSGCPNLNLAPGSPVSGTVGFNSSLVVPNGTISVPSPIFQPGAITSFDLVFGNQTIAGPSPGVPVSGNVTFNASTSTAVSFSLDAGSTAMEGTEALISNNQWTVLVPLVPFGPVTGGPGTLTRLTPIAEPATISLLAVALLGLFMRRPRPHADP